MRVKNLIHEISASQLVNLSKDRTAWTDNDRRRGYEDSRPIKLDFQEDEEDDLEPMQLSFDCE